MALVEANYNERRSALGDATSARGSVATSNGVSRLAQMQARFQQKQLQEKEQKLLHLYESQQLRAFQRVGRGSAGSSSVSSTTSSTSSSSLGNGKVRQLFDERRGQGKTVTRAAGWDRSYPLEPLDNNNHPRPRVVNQYNGHQRITRGASLDRINVEPIKPAVSRSKSQVRPGHLINGDHLDRSYRRPQPYYADEDYNYSQDDLNSSYYRDKNYNRVNYYQEKEAEPLFTKTHQISSDYEEPLRNGEVFDQSQLFKKLTNVGGILLMKERTMNEDRYKTYNAGSRRGGAGAGVAKQPLGTRRDNDAASAPSKMTTKPVVKAKSGTTNASPTNGATVQRTSLLKGPGSVSSPTRPSPAATTATTMQRPPQSGPQSGRSMPPSARGPPPPSNRGPSAASGAASAMSSAKGGPSARQSVRGGPPAVNVDLRDCRICGRHFASDRIAMHQEICAKTAQKKRKTFDPLKQRIQGTEAEAFVRMSSKKPPPKPVKKADWRRKHEDFINTIRAAKGMQAHIAAGGKLKDLPPPPPSDYSDYIQCPHCGRKFNEAAAERHIPKCATMEHNKPKPQAKGGPPARKR